MRALLSLLSAIVPSSLIRPVAHSLDVRSTGCGTSQDFAGQTKSFTINSSGGQRDYLLYLPTNYDAAKEQPLLIAYHGAGGSPEQIQYQTGYSGGDVNKDMIVAYPRGIKASWQGASYSKPGVSDKVFTTDLINELKSTYCIDTSRIYATGFSQGGGFIGTLACSPGHGGQFAALAAVEGAFYTDATPDAPCTPARKPLAILDIHSTGDGIVPYHGGVGRGGPLPAIAEWAVLWSKRNGCGENTTEELDDGIKHFTWDCGGQDKVLQHYMTNAPWHGWEGKGIDTSSVVYDFLSSHRLGEGGQK